MTPDSPLGVGRASRKISPHGLFRSGGSDWVRPFARVRFLSADIDVPEALYREQALLPEFDLLPTRAEYDVAFANPDPRQI